jgi:hypothetical protein
MESRIPISVGRLSAGDINGALSVVTVGVLAKYSAVFTGMQIVMRLVNNEFMHEYRSMCDLQLIREFAGQHP